MSSKKQAIKRIVKTTRKYETLDESQPDIVPTYFSNGYKVVNQATNGIIVSNVIGKKVFVSDKWIAENFPTWHDEEGNLLSNPVPYNKIRDRVIGMAVEPIAEKAKIQAEKIGGNQKQLDRQYDRKTKALVKSGLRTQPYFAVTRTNLQGMTCGVVDKMPALEAFGLI